MIREAEEKAPRGLPPPIPGQRLGDALGRGGQDHIPQPLTQLLDRSPEDWSLVSGFFQRNPVLVFLWTLAVAPRLVATVQRTIRTAGGVELDEEAKTLLLSQILARRLGLQAKEPFDTLTAHHPKGKPVWDLDD